MTEFNFPAGVRVLMQKMQTEAYRDLGGTEKSLFKGRMICVNDKTAEGLH